MVDNVHKHPEWKRLAEEIQPLIETTKMFTYDVLQALAGIDIRSDKGRKQFERFRKYALDEWGLWFENMRREGYRIADVSETPSCAFVRMRRAKRQNARALAITVKTTEQGASHEVITARRQLAASLGALMLATENEGKKIRTCIRKIGPASDPGAQLTALTTPKQ